MGAYFWLFLRIDSSAPHSLRVTIGGSATAGLAFTVVVVVPAFRVEDVVDDEAASAPRSSPPSGPVEVGVSAEEPSAAPAGVPVATRPVRGPWTASMARISTLRASPAARPWAWVA